MLAVELVLLLLPSLPLVELLLLPLGLGQQLLLLWLLLLELLVLVPRLPRRRGLAVRVLSLKDTSPARLDEPWAAMCGWCGDRRAEPNYRQV